MKNYRKKIMILLLIPVLILSLTACGKNDKKNPFKGAKNAPEGKFNDSGADTMDFDLTTIRDPFIKKFASFMNDRGIKTIGVKEISVDPVDALYGEIGVFTISLADEKDISIYKFNTNTNYFKKTANTESLNPIGAEGSKYNAIVVGEYALVVDDVNDEIINAFRDTEKIN